MQDYHYEDGLESNRLKTRFLEMSDATLWQKFYESEKNYAYLPNLGGKTSKENAELAMKRQINRYQSQTYGLQALVEKSTGNLVGQCGLLYQMINGRYEFEIGYQLFETAQGKGYASEAATMFRDYGFRKIGAESIICVIDVDNYPSQRVAEQIGMTQEEKITYNGVEVFIYRTTKKERGEL